MLPALERWLLRKKRASSCPEAEDGLVHPTLIWKPGSSDRTLHRDWLFLAAINLEATVHNGPQSHGCQHHLVAHTEGPLMAELEGANLPWGAGENMRLDSLGPPESLGCRLRALWVASKDMHHLQYHSCSRLK